MTVTCDICGSDFQWTEEQVAIDLSLRLMGSGLGAMCDPCGDREIAICTAQWEAEERQIAIEEGIERLMQRGAHV